MLLNTLKQTIGGLEVIQRHRNIYTAIVHTNQSLDTPLSEMKTEIIQMCAETPKFPVDFELFSFVKTFCNAEFTTGNQILQFEDNIWPQLFKQREEFQQIKGENQLIRTNFVISKKLSTEQIQSHPFFSTPNFTNYITNNENIDKNLITAKQNIIVPSFQNFSEASTYFLNLLQPSAKTFFDIGPQYLNQVIDKLDLYIITLYSGELENQFRVGYMPGFDEVQKYLKLTYKSEIMAQHKGHIQFLVFEK